MKKTLSIIVILILLAIPLCSCRSYKRPVASSIQEFTDASGGETVEIKMASFTTFEWDKMLVFNYLTSKSQIDEALGVDFTGSTDLTNGIIFVKGNEIVHFEYFDYDYSFDDEPGKFMIYPSTDNFAPKYRVFLPDEAVFSGRKQYKDDYSYYRFYPVP